MKFVFTILIVCALCVTSRASTNAMLRGIRIVETHDKPNPPRGKLGERGPYQFRRSTWRMHTSASFDLAENREVATIVAKRHYTWIESQLRAHRIEVSPYNVALAWNAGVNAVIRGTVPPQTHDYATRLINITSTLPDDTPKPWRPPTLVLEVTPPKPAKTVTRLAVSMPTPQNTYAVSNDYSPRNDLTDVRYLADPIMLAFNRQNAL